MYHFPIVLARLGAGFDPTSRVEIYSMPAVPVIYLDRHNRFIDLFCCSWTRSPRWSHNGRAIAENCSKSTRKSVDFVCGCRVHIALPKAQHAGVYKCHDKLNASLEAEKHVQSKWKELHLQYIVSLDLHSFR